MPDSSDVGSVILLCLRVEGLKRDRAVHADAGVAPFRIIPAFYPPEDGIGKLVSGLPLPGIEKLQLHGTPEGLHHRVIVTIINTAPRAEQASLAQPLTTRPGCVLAATVGMQDRALRRGLATQDGH